MQSPILFSRPLSLGDMLDWTIRIYRARFGKLILTAAIFMAPLGIITGFYNGQMMTGYLNLFMGMLQDPANPPDAAAFREIQAAASGFAGYTALITILGLVAGGLVTLALTSQAVATIHNQELSLWGGIRQGAGRFWAWLGMSLSMMVAILFLAILLVLILVVGGLILATFVGGLGTFFQGGNEPSGAAIAGIVLMMICLYIGLFVLIGGPFIYVWARWSVAVPGMVDQRWGPVESLRESWGLTRGHVWRCLGFTCLLGLFYLIIYAGLMGVAFSSSAALLASSPTASSIIFAAVGAILPILWSPISTAAFVTLYFDLRVRNQGYDLDLRIQQLESEVAGEAR